MDKFTKADDLTKDLILDILNNGSFDKNPRPKYSDGSPAHTLSVNHRMLSYDLSKGEFPLITLRPIAIKSAIGELLWIYSDQSNDLDLLKDKYKVTWWDEWALDEHISLSNGWAKRSIGCCYGETIRRHDLMNKLLNGIKNDPDGRRHIINMWQEDDFLLPHGLKPCAYQTVWNVRHSNDGDYLDMCMFQRSSDFLTAGSINQAQYAIFLYIVAHCTGYKPGVFTWMVDNVQIYDRHIEQAYGMLNRKSIPYRINVSIDSEITNFCDIKVNDIKITGYPIEKIKATNPQLKFDIGI